MQLSDVGERAVSSLSQRYGVSTDAVRTLLIAVSNGGGTMAQFYHAELGGGGQWMRGGMTMVGDMFNHGLQATVANLCSELSTLLQNQQLFESVRGHNAGGFASSGNWWPAELGAPSSSGGQNDARYAYFPHARRLAIQQNGQVSLYDTLDHQIGGVQQQQQNSYPGSLSFSSQYGTFTVESLPRADGHQAAPPQAPAPVYNNEAPPSPSNSPALSPRSHADILSALERLGSLHQKGVLSDEEFRDKKAELLARL